MRPNINTSYRAHGKWGDFLAAIIPTIWCLNILINSNFLLRMLEWQSESSLFTIRIRGRQWYWVYKIDLKTISDLYNSPKNIGSNNWSLQNNTKDTASLANLTMLQARLNSNDNIFYFSDLIKKNKKKYFKKNILSMSADYNHQTDLLKQTPCLTLTNNYTSFTTTNLITNLNLNLVLKANNVVQTSAKTSFLNLFFNVDKFFFKYKNFELTSYLQRAQIFNSSEDLLLKDRFFKKNYSANNFNVISENNTCTANNSFLISELSQKTVTLKEKFNNYITVKQKRYARKKNILPVTITYQNKKNIVKPFLIKNNLVRNSTFDLTIFYKLLKKNKNKTEVNSVLLSKRLLRTKRTLVLPAHVNITAITNSYDVIHSWFIPGLGLKLDCVPGRATHHTFFIDNYGFYYGQCAEVCGRYHHHMPIRVCALPFDHFLIWWSTFGLNKLFNLNNNNLRDNFLKKKFIW